MRKRMTKVTALWLTLAFLMVSLFTPIAGAQSSAPLQVSAQGIAWGIGTSYETAVIDLRITNFYVDPARNHTISPWVLQFDFGGDIESVTGAIITAKEGNRYTLKGDTDTDLSYGETLDLRITTKLNGAASASFQNLTLRPEVIAAPWRWLGTYKANDIVEYNGVYYKAIQAHTAYATNWTPSQTPALWQPTSIESYSYTASAEVDLTIIDTWALGGTYTAGQIIFHEGLFYSCVQSHVAYAPNWYPGPQTASLWKKASLVF
ncbi:carbohydrate-binding protein [Paenibacillus paeoniae]|uniref:Chitin-binding type-3 domain-containing protein n=1 Tax=Paenibacillus paeoniae TaxID=2292705 RepID=A0A371PGN2_9BACL|nr:carbohydrate-binding protein [Paenibacillus paeoniae]REK75004.1 hypothetical protein DX130_15310 [Paenibacillus paeoniae]